MSSAMPTAYHGPRVAAGQSQAEPGQPAALGQAGSPRLADWTVMDGHPEALVDLDAIKANVAALTSTSARPR